MLIVTVIVAIVSIAGLVASVIMSSVAAALVSVGLGVLGLSLLVVDTVRRRRRLIKGSAVTAQMPPVEHHLTAGDYLSGKREVAREFLGEERVLSRDMLGYAVPHEEAIIDICHAL